MVEVLEGFSYVEGVQCEGREPGGVLKLGEAPVPPWVTLRWNLGKNVKTGGPKLREQKYQSSGEKIGYSCKFTSV